MRSDAVVGGMGGLARSIGAAVVPLGLLWDSVWLPWGYCWVAVGLLWGCAWLPWGCCGAPVRLLQR